MKYLKVIAVVFVMGFATTSCVSYDVPFGSNTEEVKQLNEKEQVAITNPTEEINS